MSYQSIGELKEKIAQLAERSGALKQKMDASMVTIEQEQQNLNRDASELERITHEKRFLETALLEWTRQPTKIEIF